MAANPAAARDAHLRMVADVYKGVVSDVLSSCRDMFREDGVDEDILNDIHTHWEQRIRRTGSVPCYTPIDQDDCPKVFITLKIKRPAAAGRGEGSTDMRVFIPRVAVERHGQRMKEEITRLLAQVTRDKTSEADARILIEDRMDALFGAGVPQLDGNFDDSDTSSSDFDSDIDSPDAKRRKVAKENGDKEEEDDEDDGDDSSDKDSQEEEDEDDANEPALCTDDDLSDMEPSLMFEEPMDNVCCALYSKVEHNKKHHWKVELTRGVMNLDGTDYLFQTMDGEGAWL